MYKQEIKEAFSKLQASDQLVMEVLDMKQVTKQSPQGLFLFSYLDFYPQLSTGR